MQIASPRHTASGLPWTLRHEDGRVALAIAQQHGVSDLLAGILAGRGVTPDTTQHFLNPTLREYLPDPFHLRDMDKAVARLSAAIERHERIAVFGDYDVDGATSTTLLVQYFAALGIALRPYIPDRMKEGYGPSEAAFGTLIAEGARVIVTVDCGTLAHGPIALAQRQGVDVIVLDHHLSNGALPNAYAVVNPNRVDETSEHRNLAAVGVTFLTLVALNKTLRERGFFAQHKTSSPHRAGAERSNASFAGRGGNLGRGLEAEASPCDSPPPNLPPSGGGMREPNLLAMLDHVALGTVCDVMPLTGLNRAFVAQGLKVMARRGSLGLAVLGDVARMNELPNVYHLGFLLGPRINAGGRVGAAGLGVELLTSQEEVHARGIAQQLDTHNAERQAIEAMVSEQAFALAATQENMPVILVAGEGWHPGVIGIVAGRLKEKFSRPAMVITLEHGNGKASGRSVTGVDLGAAIHAALAEGLLTAGGGHAMAAGFSLESGRIQALHDFLIARMGAAVGAYQDARVMRFDAMLSTSGATLETLDDIARAGPYGVGNPNPRFVIPRAQMLHRSVMKEKHVKLVIGDASGTARLNAVAFNAIGTSLGQWLIEAGELHLLGELKANVWQGETSVQFVVEDAARI